MNLLRLLAVALILGPCLHSCSLCYADQVADDPNRDDTPQPSSLDSTVDPSTDATSRASSGATSTTTSKGRTSKKTSTRTVSKPKKPLASSLITPSPESISKILRKAGKKALGGGLPGAAAGLVQVLSLMWLRTIMNYQYRYGTGTLAAIRTLYSQGGIARFYKGVEFAVIQGPLSRFGSTAANDGVNALLASLTFSEKWGAGRSTFIASLVVGMWRIILMPIDTCKTVLQVDSTAGFKNLIRKVKAGKISVLYQGAMALYASSMVGHYPWFYVYNFLNKASWLPNMIESKLVRNAFVGFVASVVSDIVSNSIRVIKTTKQSIATKHAVSYTDAVGMILAADGWKGLFCRGLRTRIIANGFQSVVFTVAWRGLAEYFADKNEEGKEEAS
ncbi:hypothetical protein TrVE_jg2643 [Triparma verrucosa]|uniref:Mitochondrial carrier protein n=1 Tax=Triparma verrucosa TaxID=1606542 RepID=A0A9W7BFL1_9STRA|nr:hypothetical protein TrVE_jg2643 [Triparma verrucosa]